MYQTILVTLDGTATDRAIIEHIKQLATLARSRLVLLHVADGWAARTYGPDAVSPEIAEDTAYLEKIRSEFQAAGIPAVRLGTSGGQDLTLPDGGSISIAALRAANERFFPSWMDGTTL